MKWIAYLMVLMVLGSSLTGCHECPEPKVVTEYKYLKVAMPKVQDKPQFIDYEIKAVNFNGEDYYFMRRLQGNIMLNNWNSYKDWSETNYSILKSIEDNNTKEIE